MNQSPTPETYYAQIPPKKQNSLSVAALVCGIIAFLINPLYLVSATAIILGIVAICSKNQSSKGLAITGICCGVGSFILQLILDLVLSVFTFGFSFCI